ncbi:glutamate-5-semialdehyde dehydrogenase [Adhaeribacter pallidiroseus]|uniref:Gamma-glutamyl phosphate reductase n=1 Tax=Adhaeribacter pallidiroseus TaxID=2072847 RepID=A0A369QA74_9BACT|nr:glutamate-5-semialdehyde dehydrogenase [Adhaeribacter pallidiroseus]RDC61803.1 Glutamate-5-semialdehyde dehydrogenase [Adhaeribacter pallidiroseus]
MTLQDTFKNTQKASQTLGLVPAEKINAILLDLATQAVAQTDLILSENEKDLARMNPDDPKYDRLKLTAARLEDIARDLRNVAGLPSPLGRTLLQKDLPNGLEISKISVPLGVVGIIYEARPNVTFDVFSLCLKTGNACILKGGSDAADSNAAILKIIHEVLAQHQIDPNIVALLPLDRSATEALLQARGFVDVLIPRGSQGLIDMVRQNAKIPVIETGAGIVHTFFDETGNLEKGKAIIANAKTRRVSVCNALDCLLVHENRLPDLPELTSLLAEKQVEIFADEPAFAVLKETYPAELLKPAQEEHFGIEFLSLKLALKTVKDLNAALAHIAAHSSKHSEAIISEDAAHVAQFLNSVDAAAVFANTSTAFTDGAQFGLGAEIGISTQKLHARGPMGLEELTSYKWVVKGNGQIRV